jgi:uncharacterized protein (TIGR02996 family)
MSTLLGFLQDSKAHPDDDTPRLILADWLEDHDDPARAELIRLQVRPEQGPEFTQIRVAQLTEQHGQRWLGALAPYVNQAWSFRRGLLHLEADASVLFAHNMDAPTTSIEAAWIESMDMIFVRRQMFRLADSPWLSLPSSLNLGLNNLGSVGVQNLAGHQALTFLHRLDLRGNHLTSDGLDALFQAKGMPGLRELDLGVNEIGSQGMQRLVRRPWPWPLRVLRLDANSIGEGGLAGLPRAGHFGSLEELSLAHNDLQAASAEALARSPALGRLKVLNLSHNRLYNSGAIALADATHFHSLEVLDLSHNAIDRRGAEALLERGPWPALRRLDLANNPIPFNMTAEFVRVFGERVRFE